jgi:glucokinase
MSHADFQPIRKMKMQNYIGIDIGGTKTAIVLGDSAAQIHHRIQFATETPRGPEWCLQQIKRNVREILITAPVSALGVSCGGPLDPKNGVILSPPNLPGWDQIPISQILRDAFGLPVRLMNDANAGALAEWQFGAGKGTQHMIFLTFGTGLGAGLILNGALLSGTNDLAGEVGHIRISETGPVGYGKMGSFEGYCSGPGLVRLAQRRLPQTPLSAKPLLERAGSGDKITARDIAELALAADPFCENIVAECGHYFGKGLSLLIDLFNPERIVVGSMGVRLGELLFAPARNEINREALIPAAAACAIVPAQLGEKIGDVAALCVAQYEK